MSSDGSPAPASDHPETTCSVLEVDLATLARTIREPKALPLTDPEADTLASSLEGSRSDEELLANTLNALRLIIDRLEPSSRPLTVTASPATGRPSLATHARPHSS